MTIPVTPAQTDFIWTGNWQDAVAFMDRVGYSVPFLGAPAMYLCERLPENNHLHVDNVFTQIQDRAYPGDTIRWHQSTQSFSVITNPIF